MKNTRSQSNVCVIYDTDESYIEKLTGAMEKSKGKSLKIIAFTKQELIEKYAASNHISILVISEYDYSNEIEKHIDNIDNIILLSEEYKEEIYADTPEILKNQKITVMYKYQSAENIIKQVEKFCQSKYISTASETTIVGVYSPINCAYKTSFSLALGNIYAQKYRTLYINLEEFSGLDEILPDKNNWNLSDFQYCYEFSKQEFIYKLQEETGVINDNTKMKYIAPVKCASDMSYITVPKLADMIRYIAEQRIFDIIVLDISNMVCEQWKLMDICNKVYMPIKDDYISKKKLNSFETYLLSGEDETVCDNIEKIQVPYDEESKLGLDFIKKLGQSGIGKFAWEMAYE